MRISCLCAFMFPYCVERKTKKAADRATTDDNDMLMDIRCLTLFK